MSKATDISKINEHSPYYDMTPGNQIYGGGGSRKFCTGEWRTKTPVIDWEKCTQCLLCTPVCPDSCIPVKDGKFIFAVQMKLQGKCGVMGMIIDGKIMEI